MALVRTLIDQLQSAAPQLLTRDLQELYDGDLRFPDNSTCDPYVIANFVATLDGIVSYKIPGHAGGSTISGGDQADRFIMGLLRASVDAVMVGAGTVHDVGRESLWISDYIYPTAAPLYANYRVNTLRKKTYPLVVIVSGSGRLDLSRAIFRTPTVRTAVITTSAGRAELINAGVTALTSVEVHILDDDRGRIESRAILQLLRGLGVRSLLHEGGPRLFGQFLANGAVDELFLTLSPQIAGRSEPVSRPALIDGVEFLPDSAPWFELVTVKQKANHLYLRYRHRREIVE